MKMVIPLQVGPAIFSDPSVSFTSGTEVAYYDTSATSQDISLQEYSDSATYDAEDQVLVATFNPDIYDKIYESVQNSNTGNDPETDDGTWWVEIGASNQFKAFDGKISSTTDQSAISGDLTFNFFMAKNCDTICLFNFSNVTNINIRVNYSGSDIYDEDIDPYSSTYVTDWYEFFTVDPLDSYKSNVIVSVPAHDDSFVYITLEAPDSGIISVGEIVFGNTVNLGETVYGTSTSILDFSTKDTDTFGNFEVLERGFQDEVNFQFNLFTQNTNKVKQLLASRRAKPTVYFSDFDQEEYGLVAYGYYEDFDIPLSTPSLSTATLEVRGLV